MKKIYSIIVLLFIAATRSWAAGPDTADILLKHSVMTNDSVFIDSPVTMTSPPPYYLRYDFVNLGPDSISSIDTLFLKTPYTAIELLLPAGFWHVGDTVYFLDTVQFNSGPANGNFNWCDSVWLKDTIGPSGSVVYDPNIQNNKTCNNVIIHHITHPAGISEKLSAAPKYRGQPMLTVYPNPAAGNFSFDYLFPNYGTKATVYIRDIVGRTVVEKELGTMTGAQKVNLDVSGLSAGTYLVELRANNIRSIGKVTIQK